MRLGIYSNISRDTDYEIANLCASNILELGGVPVFEESFKDEPLIFQSYPNTGSSVFLLSGSIREVSVFLPRSMYPW